VGAVLEERCALEPGAAAARAVREAVHARQRELRAAARAGEGPQAWCCPGLMNLCGRADDWNLSLLPTG
jgi:hypothetical protein